MNDQQAQPTQWPPQQPLSGQLPYDSPQYGTPPAPNQMPPSQHFQRSARQPLSGQLQPGSTPLPNNSPLPQQAQWPPQQAFQSQQVFKQPLTPIPDKGALQQPQRTAQQFTPPQKSPPKKGFFSRKVEVPVWAIILILIIILGLIGNAASKSGSTDTAQNSSSTLTTNQKDQTATAQTIGNNGPTVAPTQPPAPTPTHAPKWTTIQTFTGNGTKKTAVFHVGDDWKIIWSCDPSSFYGGQYNVQVYIYNSDNTPLDLAVNTICKAGNTGDSTEEHQGGDVYLDINSEGAWKIQVQELQ